MAPETSQTLDRGLQVLAVLAGSQRGMSVSEVAEATRVNRTAVHRLVATLELHGLARRDHAGRYHVGLGVLGLARAVQPVLRDVALPTLRTLAEELGMTAHLTIADGGEALAVAVVEPTWTNFHVAYRVGARHRLEQGAAGRAILVGRERTRRRRPWVHSEGELQAGATGISAPVLGVEGLEASVGIVTLGDLDTRVVVAQVTAAARQVANQLQ